jgi:hypothetical protein
MKRYSDFTASFFVFSAFLTGCGAPALSVASSAPQMTDSASAVKGSAFLYVAAAHPQTTVKIFTYPKIRLVGQVPSDESFASVCSDPKTGHVFVSQTHGLDEYMRGQTKKIATLPAPSGYNELEGCSVDPISGDVAVVTEGAPTAVMVYPHGNGTPLIYTDPSIISYYYSSYDASGNLFVLGYGLHNKSITTGFAELATGSNMLTDITLDESVGTPQKLQWDGQYMALDKGGTIYRVRVVGTEGKIVSTTLLGSGNPLAGGDLWIDRNKVLGPYGKPPGEGVGVGLYNYPAGGDPISVTHGVVYKGTIVSDLNLSVLAKN